jgi:hypothetical protein
LTQLVIDIPASLATLLPSAPTLDAIGHALAAMAVVPIFFFLPCLLFVLAISSSQKRAGRIAREQWTRENSARHNVLNKVELIDHLRRSNGWLHWKSPTQQTAFDALMVEGRIEKIDDFDHYRVLDDPINAERETLDRMRARPWLHEALARSAVVAAGSHR